MNATLSTTALPAVTAILGALLGAWLTYVVQRKLNQTQRKERQAAATMMVASMLREWLQKTPQLILELEEWDQSDEVLRSSIPISELPSFPFEKTLELVTQLDGHNAKEVFDLVYIKSDANDGINAAIRFASEDDAVEETRGRIAQIFLAAITIYKTFAKQIGWQIPEYLEVQAFQMQKVLSEWQRSPLHHEASTYYRDEIVAKTLG